MAGYGPSPPGRGGSQSASQTTESRRRIRSRSRRSAGKSVGIQRYSRRDGSNRQDVLQKFFHSPTIGMARPVAGGRGKPSRMGCTSVDEGSSVHDLTSRWTSDLRFIETGMTQWLAGAVAIAWPEMNCVACAALGLGAAKWGVSRGRRNERWRGGGCRIRGHRRCSQSPPVLEGASQRRIACCRSTQGEPGATDDAWYRPIYSVAVTPWDTRLFVEGSSVGKSAVLSASSKERPSMGSFGVMCAVRRKSSAAIAASSTESRPS